MRFEWDESKDHSNIIKHGVDFSTAREAFADSQRILLCTRGKSVLEPRYWCIGKVFEGILTVSFTLRKGNIRIINAGYFRKGKVIYEKKYGLQG